MALLKLKTASLILLEDDYNKNLVPLITELVKDDNSINIFCYEYPTSYWQNVFKSKNVTLYDDAIALDSLNSRDKNTVIIDSVNQMAICLGWNKFLKYLRELASQPMTSKLIMIFHKDCIVPGSKMQTHLNHIANGIVSYDAIDPCKIKVQIKTGGKIIKSDESLSYDYNTSVLTSRPIKQNVKEEAVEEKKISPSDLSTFKIEVDQLNQLAKNQLKLPYMSKINEGQGKVYYEPDAVDDWDDEDPDDDLDI